MISQPPLIPACLKCLFSRSKYGATGVVQTHGTLLRHQTYLWIFSRKLLTLCHRKVIIILEELGLPYNHTKVEFSDVKNPDYLKVNPNGRLPAIKDPNTGVVLWEVR